MASASLKVNSKLCDVDWPAFNIGWPAGGLLDPKVIWVVWLKFTGFLCHPEQFPYTDQWLTQKPWPWLKICVLCAHPRILVSTDHPHRSIPNLDLCCQLLKLLYLFCHWQLIMMQKTSLRSASLPLKETGSLRVTGDHPAPNSSPRRQSPCGHGLAITETAEGFKGQRTTMKGHWLRAWRQSELTLAFCGQSVTW